jgi:hypothetical protein
LSCFDVSDVQRVLRELDGNLSWAGEEINAAQQRHPTVAERVDRGFVLLRPTHPLMRREMLYRAHCRELLDRVARGEDTRPGTAAEGCIALSVISLMVPLRSSAFGLYLRLWRLAGLPPIAATSDEHYEALHALAIDDDEVVLRDKLRQPWRTLNTGPSSTPRRRTRRRPT